MTTRECAPTLASQRGTRNIYEKENWKTKRRRQTSQTPIHLAFQNIFDQLRTCRYVSPQLDEDGIVAMADSSYRLIGFLWVQILVIVQQRRAQRALLSAREGRRTTQAQHRHVRDDHGKPNSSYYQKIRVILQHDWHVHDAEWKKLNRFRVTKEDNVIAAHMRSDGRRCGRTSLRPSQAD